MGYDQEQIRMEDLSLNHPDPIMLELNRLQNLLKEKDRDMGAAHGEIKALRAAESLKDKALELLRVEVDKLNEKLQFNENLLEHKNLEMKKLSNEKKDALAAQYAAEATLRRVYANQKDNDSLPIDSILAPLESEIKMYKTEIAILQEDKKALERHRKSKESALIEAEKILRSALERALIVEEVQNQNFELRRQIEICHEENHILEKTNRQKVLEVEKLSLTIQNLEESILSAGATANTIRDYKRQIEELNEEKRTLERELARVKVSANRVATVVANEWKDENAKVMPVKQWLEERRLLQAEMQRLRDKLAVSERTAKAEAQLKEKLKLRLKTLEEGLKKTNTICGYPRTEKPNNNILGFLTSNGRLKKRSTSQPRASSIGRLSILKQPNLESEKKCTFRENIVRRSIWAPKSKVIDNSEKENAEIKENGDINETNQDMVSGFLYDKLQKEVIGLRKMLEVKDGNLNAKDEEVKMLLKKVDTLTKSNEVESKKMKRELAASSDKEFVGARKSDEKKIARSINSKRLEK